MDVTLADEHVAFGSLLRSYRLAAGLSQEELAERARLSSVSVSALERGIRRAPYRATVASLAQALGLAADERARLVGAAVRSGRSRVVGLARNENTEGRRSNIPLSLSTFLGRTAELAEITAMLAEKRLITLTGAGGVGKTRAALEVGSALASSFPDGAWLVELAPLGNPSLVAAAIVFALQIQASPSRSAGEQLVSFLQNKALLLILDNCEHIVDEAARVTEALLRGCPEVRILATCREPLRVAGERVYRIPSLTVPSSAAGDISAADAAEYEAIALFTERAQSLDRHFALTDTNAPVIAAICRRLDGIPLAIELAAARVTILGLDALCERLGRRLAILTGGDHRAPPRHQTMRALIDWSYDLLSAPEQRFFVRLSAFAGGCTLAAAQNVCAPHGSDPDTLDILAALVDKSMVVADLDGPEPRYRLLESAREYAREKLAASGEALSVARSHALAYLGIAEQLDREYETCPDGEWFWQARAELSNWQAALEWSLVTTADVLLGQRLVGALSPVWTSFALTEGRRWIAAARADIDEGTPLRVVAQLEFTEGSIGLALRELRLTLACAERATYSYRSLGDAAAILRAQALTGFALKSMGRFSEAEPLLRGCLADARILGNRMLIARIQRSIGFIRGEAGDLTAARAAFAHALAIFSSVHADRDASLALLMLAEVEFGAGDAHAALRLANEALEKLQLVDAMREAATPAVLLSNTTAYLIALARYDEAETRARQALEIARDQQHGAAVAWTLQHLIAIATLRWVDDDAERQARCDERAARVVGFIDAQIESFGSPRQYTERQEYERIVQLLRDRIGTDKCSRLLAQGSAMTQDQATQEALSMLVLPKNRRADGVARTPDLASVPTV